MYIPEILGGGRNVEFQNVDRPKISERRNGLFSWSEHQNQNVENVFWVDQNVEIQKDQNVESVHLFSIKVIRTSKIKNINYLWRITYGYQGLWGVRLG